MPKNIISLEGINENNLKNIDVEFALNEITTITGKSGAGKTSLGIGVCHSAGQRAYLQTFSTYTRQFLDKYKKPEVKKINNLPPTISITQKNKVRSSRSNVGSITEINEYLKLLFSGFSLPYCLTCEKIIKIFSNNEILQDIKEFISIKKFPIKITFSKVITNDVSKGEVISMLLSQGFTSYSIRKNIVCVTYDEIHHDEFNDNRFLESIEGAFAKGNNSIQIFFGKTKKDYSKSPLIKNLNPQLISELNNYIR